MLIKIWIQCIHQHLNSTTHHLNLLYWKENVHRTKACLMGWVSNESNEWMIKSRLYSMFMLCMSSRYTVYLFSAHRYMPLNWIKKTNTVQAFWHNDFIYLCLTNFLFYFRMETIHSLVHFLFSCIIVLIGWRKILSHSSSFTLPGSYGRCWESPDPS